eukprot:TRINITY_DN4040_c0_g3_i2.p1 TRINITY_DN4040_c0_g3~~TRINITY_DN4040_c0_g3_i2.p1  ORF type:complete len:309 (-),score=48.82 TRINITY_DN4040_c0_g3_i2:24-950(-)
MVLTLMRCARFLILAILSREPSLGAALSLAPSKVVSVSASGDIEPLHEPIRKEPQGRKDVCFFVTTNTVNTSGVAQAEAVVSTWAQKTTPGSQVYYFASDSSQPLPASVRPEQILHAVAATWLQLTTRIAFQLQTMSSVRFADTCDWFALVDDDTYVNVASVVEKTRGLDAFAPHYMGPVFDSGGMPFVQGAFVLFSSAAMPIVAAAVEQCSNMHETGLADVELSRCLQEVPRDLVLLPEVFGVIAVDNDHLNPHPATLQIALKYAKDHASSLSCFDLLHKMYPDDMYRFHSLVGDSPPCDRGLIVHG